MSQIKRRKKRKLIKIVINERRLEEDVKKLQGSDLLPFQIELVELFSPSDVRFYIVKQRRKDKDLETQWRKMEGVKKVAYILKNAEYSESLQYSSQSHHSKLHTLLSVIRKVSHSSLEKVYKKYIGNEIVEPDTCRMDLLFKFYGKETSDERRAAEIENLKELENMLNSNEFRFLEMCDQIIPVEIIQVILSYLPRDYSVMNKVGSVNKIFYLTILQNWKRILLTKKTMVRTISLLVLQNIEHLVIKKTDESRLTYILENINPKKLKSFQIVMHESYDEHFPLTSVVDVMKEKIGSFKEVRFLDLSKCRFLYDIGEVFPNVEILKVNTELRFFLCFKHITRIFPRLRDVTFNGGFNNFIYEYKNLYSNNLTRVCFARVNFTRYFLPHYEVFAEFIINCANLESLEIEFHKAESFEDHKEDACLDLSKITGLLINTNNNNKKKLVIDAEHCYVDSYHKKKHQGNRVGVKYPQNEIFEELHIKSFHNSSEFEVDEMFEIDLNLQDMLSSNFFFSSNTVTRKLFIDVPFLSRRIQYIKLEKSEIIYNTKNGIIPAFRQLYNLLRDSNCSFYNSLCSVIKFTTSDCFFRDEVLEMKKTTFFSGGIQKLSFQCGFDGDDCIEFRKEIFNKKYNNFADDDDWVRFLAHGWRKSIVQLFVHLFVFHGEMVKTMERNLYDIVEFKYLAVGSFGDFYFKRVREKLEKICSSSSCSYILEDFSRIRSDKFVRCSFLLTKRELGCF